MANKKRSKEKSSKKYEIKLILSEEAYGVLKNYLMIKHMTGDLVPGADPLDSLAMIVGYCVEKEKSEIEIIEDDKKIKGLVDKEELK